MIETQATDRRGNHAHAILRSFLRINLSEILIQSVQHDMEAKQVKVLT